MIALTQSDRDDLGFIKKSQVLLNEFLQDVKPTEVFILKVDNWFDKKWLNFAGTILGAVDIWKYDEHATLPPFSPNRIVEQFYYQLNDATDLYELSRDHDNFEIHRRQPSAENLGRKIVDIAPSAVFIWYSSNTVLNGQGSMMIYPAEAENCQPFYVGFRKHQTWEVVSAPGTNKKLLQHYIERSKKALES